MENLTGPDERGIFSLVSIICIRALPLVIVKTQLLGMRMKSFGTRDDFMANDRISWLANPGKQTCRSKQTKFFSLSRDKAKRINIDDWDSLSIRCQF
jgi:hypothetical protein